MPSVLWWGRSDPGYSRNRIVLRLLSDLGWNVASYHPIASQFGLFEAYLRRLRRPDLIWVPCFRQRDMASATHWARKWGVPIVADPLISAYEKEVFEREKWVPGSAMAEKRRRWEARLLVQADIVLADTPAHADFFSKELGITRDKLGVLYVGAETEYFRPAPMPSPVPPFEILFYGSFLPLQGADVIVAAARQTEAMPFRWVLLGEGPMRGEIQRRSAGLRNVTFEPWIDYKSLPGRLARAHILLGIFGTTLKADMVIPNKVFQAMSMGRPVITRAGSAYQETLSQSDVVGWVPQGDPDALAACVRKWLASPEKLADRGKKTRVLFETYFGHEKLREMLSKILARVVP